MNRPGRMVLCVLAAALAACGGASSEDKTARAIASDLRSEEAFASDVSVEEARCVGDEIVAALGVDSAQTLGREEADPDDEVDEQPFVLASLTEDDIAAIGDAMDRCVEDLDAIVVDLVATGVLDSPDEEFPISDSEARCVGEAVVDDIAFGRLLAIGLANDDAGDLGALTSDEAVVFGAAFSGCIDVRMILLDQVAASGAEPEVVACLDDQISDGAIESLFVDTFAGNDVSAEDAFAEAIDACA